MSKQIKEIIKDVAIALVIALAIIQFVRPTVVKETSMEPTLQNNNYVFLSKQAYRFKNPKRGDVIVFKSNLDNKKGGKKLLIKRVIGLPGENIKIKDNVVSINGEVLNEEYIRNPGITPGDIDVDIPEGKIFVMGDNRENSVDSRSEDVGCIDIDKIVGRAFFRLFPLEDAGKIK